MVPFEVSTFVDLAPKNCHLSCTLVSFYAST
jgi:hypothetical protein